MKARHIVTLSVITCAGLMARAWVIDWDKIEHWAGSGTNRAALVVQFADDGPKEAYVWGFRWNDGDFEGEGPSGEQLFRGIVAECPDLLLFTQFTGSMGSTVDGIGYFNPSKGSLANKIGYDFDGAKNDGRVSFNYFSPNEFMGQTSAPGNFTPTFCRRAINEAVDTRIIEHPINAKAYGYPAYDYDWWQPKETLDLENERWNAGWYDGYWSYWVGGIDSEELSYSGLGYSSRKLRNNGVDGWKYTFLDGPVTGDIDGSTGASEQWHELNYAHFKLLSSIQEISEDISGNETVVAIFGTDGCRYASLSELPSGIYIVRFSNNRIAKILKK